jgi:hypothetical protein
MPTVGSILGGAFRLLRDKPLAVAAWGGIYLVLSVFVGLAMRSFMGDLTATAGDPQAALAHMSSIFGLSMLVWLLTAIVYCILLAAVYRAVLRPADTGLGAYLKLGLDEFLLFILLVIFVVVF